MDKFNLLVRKVAYTIASECIESKNFIGLRKLCHGKLRCGSPIHFFGAKSEIDELNDWVDARIEREFAKEGIKPDNPNLATVTSYIHEFTLQALIYVGYPFKYGNVIQVGYSINLDMVKFLKKASNPYMDYDGEFIYYRILGSALVVDIPVNEIKETTENAIITMVPVRNSDTGEIEDFEMKLTLVGKYLPF